MKLKVFLLCFFLSVFSVTAQVSVSPEHDFYSMANGWLLKGYVKQLPQIKPYPVNVIKKILNEVAVCGNTTEEDKAKILYEEIFNKKWNLSIALGFSENISKDEITTEMNNSEFYDGEFSFFGDTEINNLFSLGYDLSFYGFNTNVDFETDDAFGEIADLSKALIYPLKRKKNCRNSNYSLFDLIPCCKLFLMNPNQHH